ncbi:MAG TPA: acyltransferase family protein [Nocardioidaceae bacterium]|nr:acyltransferase family protein [Nocardioidaceae bacterium]
MSTLTRRPDAGPGPRAEKRRDPWFDNAKMLLVTLVVVGHSWTLLPETALNMAVYDFLYLWHVPAFVMVTGYLSRSFTYSRRNLDRLLTTVLVPYLVFEAAIAAFRVYVGGEELDLLFADPHWPMWYLAVLFLWRLVTPVLTSIPSRVAIAATVTVSLLGGLTTGDVFDTARAMGLLPFFTLGLLVRPEHLELLRRPLVRLGSVAALLVAFGLAWMIDGAFATEWLYWRSSYAELDTALVAGIAARLGLLLAGGLLAVAFLALVPRSTRWFTRLGAATLVVYVFHGFAVKIAEYSGLRGWADGYPALSLLLATVAAVGVALALATPPVARRLNLFVDPVGSIRRRRREKVST